MEIEKFGSITEKDGDLLVDGFDFSGRGDHLDALIAIRKRFSDEVDKVLAAYPNEYMDLSGYVNKPEQMMKLNKIKAMIKQLNAQDKL